MRAVHNDNGVAANSSGLGHATRAGARRARVGVAAATFGVALIAGACGGDSRAEGARSRDTSKSRSQARADAKLAPDTAERTLAYAAGDRPYRVDSVPVVAGTVSGQVFSMSALPVDTLVSPNADSTRCAAFVDITLPVPRGAKAGATHTIGNAVVWLLGVTHGPRDGAPKRLDVTLDDCHLDPRVQRAPMGATIIAGTRDRMAATLRFESVGSEAQSPRATVSFTDPGQVVPTSLALARPGLVRVRDPQHPWIVGYVAVAPHPFVAVTNESGAFDFEGVPTGTYRLVVWHERFGARVMLVTVVAGQALRLNVAMDSKGD